MKRNNKLIYNMLVNSLLNYAYFPAVIQSLCVLKCKPTLSISTCLYILYQTFNIIKEQEFCARLFESLFIDSLSKDVVERIESPWSKINSQFSINPNQKQAPPLNPAFYVPLFQKPIHLTRISTS